MHLVTQGHPLLPPCDFATREQATIIAIQCERDDMDGWQYNVEPCSVEGHWLIMIRDEDGNILGAL